METEEGESRENTSKRSRNEVSVLSPEAVRSMTSFSLASDCTAVHSHLHMHSLTHTHILCACTVSLHTNSRMYTHIT